MRTADAPRAGEEGRDWSDAVLRWCGRVLVAATWVSRAIFAIYIVAFFCGVALRGAADRWNESLPGLHNAAAPAAPAAIGVHFLAGGVLLLATWLFTRGVWLPRAISGLVGGLA